MTTEKRGEPDMAISNAAVKAKMKLLERFFPEATQAQAETFEILMDLDQISTMLSSMEDVRQGRLVRCEDAFGDL